MTDSHPIDPPSRFIAHWAAAIVGERTARPRALDVAMGSGRHAVHLAAIGYLTFGVDIRLDAVQGALRNAAHRGVSVHAWCADLTRSPLPRKYFDLIVVSRYLQRDLFPALTSSLAPGGVLLYETFTEAQRVHGRGPTSADHLLKSQELPMLARGLEIVFYEEVTEPDAVACLVAQRRRSPS